MKDKILAVDCGTQSTRVLLFSVSGELIDKEQVTYEPYVSPKPGWAEQNAEVYWESLCDGAQKLKARHPEAFGQLLGVGVTTQRGTMVNVDEAGNPLRPSIVWLDQRKAENVFKPNLIQRSTFSLLKLRETLTETERKAPCNWIRQNQPDIWVKTHKYLQVSGFLNHKLTGHFVDSVASQIGYIPFDSKKLAWSDGKQMFEMSAKLCPVEGEKLPRLVSTGEEIGWVTAAAAEQTGIPANVPVIACGSDKGCETLGTGVTDSTIASLSFGTTATVQTTVSRYVTPIPFFPAYPSLIPGHWNPEIEIYRGYWMIRWFKDEFAYREVQKAEQLGIPVEDVLNELLTESPPGAMGLIVQPYWSPGLRNKYAKGAMIGFGDVHKKSHVYRAVIEGLAYGLLDGMHGLERRGKFRFHKVTVSGGASQSDEICQITSDIFNMPLLRGETHETSGLGAAIAVAYGRGVYPTLQAAVGQMVRYRTEFSPNPAHVSLYRELFHEVYQKMYKQLEPLYKKIQEIVKYPE